MIERMLRSNQVNNHGPAYTASSETLVRQEFEYTHKNEKTKIIN